MKNNYAVIMAGGGGTRLWPLSRKKSPKQMLNIASERTMFQTAYDRIESLFTSERILVVTVSEQAEILHAQCPDIPLENFLIEPSPKGTASVVGLAAIAIQKRNPNGMMTVLTADHHIENVDYFQSLLISAAELANEGNLVTLGINPSFPSSGYGYIQMGRRVGVYNQHEAFEGISFKEKPAKEKAKEYLRSNDHVWNSGMFIWRVDRIMAEFETQMGPFYKQMQLISRDWDSEHAQETFIERWNSLKKETIDYGVMENAQDVVVLPAYDLGWNDVGTWDSLYEVVNADQDGNIILTENFLGFDTKTSLVYSKGQKKLLVTIGVDNLVIVDTGDVLLVCDKDQTQKVRDVVTHLREQDLEDYL
ncbi:MAG: mannose-1-phosphate guanylyltransferase [Anaerolineaceae bacterium]|nr:mannose-1-phosphate guanylyltransferase [Anaerolineaceae bacterium]